MFRQSLSTGFSALTQSIAKCRWRYSISVAARLRYSFTKFFYVPSSIDNTYIYASRFVSIHARPLIQLLNTSQSKDCLLINWNSNEGGQEKSYQGKFDNFWLRDNCQCSQCHNGKQRMFDTASLPTDIQPKQVTLFGEENCLEIIWQDGHESNYSANWLLENAYMTAVMNGLPTSIHEADPVKKPVSWGREIEDDPPRVGYNGVLTEDRSLLEVSDKIDVHGFCLIEGAPLETAGTEDLIKRFGAIRNTLYGMVWIVEPDNHVVFDPAYTNTAIEPHTDTIFLRESPGLMFMHVLKFEVTESGPCYNYFVDGQKLSETIKEENPVHYQILCNVPLPYCFVDDHNKYFNSCIPFTVDPETQRLSELNFKNQYRLPLNKLTLESLHKINPSGSLLDVYEAIQTFLKTMRRKELQFTIQLEPGTVMVLNNHRVMHARMGFKGKRTLIGGYINKEDWRSNVMTLRNELS